jgi:2-keto-4-pentenoate hydratase/2-oxohepta-3-ene-1,7-dioic acid hydratase in catechol pathway
MYPAAMADCASLVPNSSRVVCVGLSDRNQIQELGHELPEYPLTQH